MLWKMRLSLVAFANLALRWKHFILHHCMINCMTSADKITVGLLCGGRSGEHKVSLISALNIQKALDPDKYNVAVIGIERSGNWYLSWDKTYIHHSQDIRHVSLNVSKPVVLPLLNGDLIEKETQRSLAKIDVYFPITHGPYGEDGTLQGFLRSLQVPYVGADVTGSAICMDKDVSKRLLRDSGMPVTPFITVTEPHAISFEEASMQLGTPLFAKPCRLGSSLGVSKISNPADFEQATNKAFQYDRKILIEQAVEGREIECAVLGNTDPKTSEVLGEIVPRDEFYSYQAKYVEEDGAKLFVPAQLPADVTENVRLAAIAVYTILECEGMARIDFFVKDDGSFIINEVNTLPGFTNISMYPKLWEASGLSQRQLLDRLIELALERFQREKMLLISEK